jgi:hypothetical protein
MAQNRRERLDHLRRNKRNRSVEEAEDLLRAFGWTERNATKEGSCWQKGSRTLTLPNSHGKPLKTPYVSLVVREIDTADGLEEEEEDEEEE